MPYLSPASVDQENVLVEYGDNLAIHQLPWLTKQDKIQIIYTTNLLYCLLIDLSMFGLGKLMNN